MLFAKEIFITVEESKGGGALSWRVVFLVLLLVSAVAVTIGVSIAELDVVNVLAGGIRTVGWWMANEAAT
jgi:hypothetical protein